MSIAVGQCQNCGGMLYLEEGEDFATCDSCGCSFDYQKKPESVPEVVIESHGDNQVVHNEIHIHNAPQKEEEDDEEEEEEVRFQVGHDHCEITPTHSKDDFIRSAWIEFARQDPPKEIFDCNLSAVNEVEHQVFAEILEVILDYSATIGTNREEAYTEMETYYEEVPYVTTERSWNEFTKSNETHQVTKLKKVARQRPVIKTKTVIDWKPFSSRGATKSLTMVENLEGVKLDTELFLHSFKTGGEKPRKIGTFLAPSAAAKSATIEAHKKRFFKYINDSLPGDYAESVHYSVTDIKSKSDMLYNAKEYNASISYEGKTYVKRAFPFGDMKVAGDTVENEKSPEKFKKKTNERVKKENENDKNNVSKSIWEKTSAISISALVLLVISMIISCFVRSSALVIILFVLAVAAYLCNHFITANVEKNVEIMTRNRIKSREARAETEINKYLSDYRNMMLELLNKKLKSLGYEQISEEEFNRR